jgi:hypothetical protein
MLNLVIPEWLADIGEGESYPDSSQSVPSEGLVREWVPIYKMNKVMNGLS